VNFKNRVEHLEGKIRPTSADTLAGAIGGCVVTTLPGGRLRMPDGRELSKEEFDALAAQYANASGPQRHILILDEDE
jgi:hypothetical protein